MTNLWKPPPTGVLKVNVDALVANTSNHFGIGIVGRDSMDNVIFAEERCLIGCLSPHLALSAVNAIKNVSPFSDDALLAGSITSICNSTSEPEITHCSRNANSAAHDLAVYGRATRM